MGRVTHVAMATNQEQGTGEAAPIGLQCHMKYSLKRFWIAGLSGMLAFMLGAPAGAVPQ